MLIFLSFFSHKLRYSLEVYFLRCVTKTLTLRDLEKDNNPFKLLANHNHVLVIFRDKKQNLKASAQLTFKFWFHFLFYASKKKKKKKFSKLISIQS